MMTQGQTSRPAPGARDVLNLAWPMTLKAVFLHGVVVIDGMLIAPLGETALAAVGLAAAIGGLVSGAIFAFSNALQLRTAQAFGDGDRVFRRSALACGLAIGILIGALGVMVILLAGRSLLETTAPSADVAAQAWAYLSLFSIVIAAEAVGQNLASHFNGCGQARIPLYGYCLSIPVNILLSAALIHGLFGAPALGVAGAAIGSAVAVSLQTAYLAQRAWATDSDLAAGDQWRNGTFWATLRRHFAFSWPIAVTFVSANYAARVCMLIYAQMSIAGFAAMTLIVPWIMLAGTLGMQWAQATGILVAQLLGERRSEEVLDRFLSAAWRASFIAAGLVAVVYLAIVALSSLVYPSLTGETRAILASFALVLVALPFPKQSNAICGNTLRASGDTHYVMHLFVWSQWLFRVPATALLVLVLKAPPVWILSLLFWEELLKFPMFHRRLWRGDWKRATLAA